jgi:glycosyltransferase involved in cell wall biosynthesis
MKTSEIALVITSFNRPDLLKQTTDSLIKFADYLFTDYIIIEDSGSKEMNEHLKRNYDNWHLILHDQNKGAYESIDEAYSHVKTPYVFHCEDDWLFTKGGFIKPALDVLKSNPSIMQVNLSNEQNMPIEPEILKAGKTEYRIMGKSNDGFWEGFTCNPSIRSMAGYEKTKPWTQYANKLDDGYFLALHEMKAGKRYKELGYHAAVLNEYFCKHIGLNRCTWHENK